ncbi:methylcrotonyl-CoA carboxylase subunit beta [Pseudomonas aeruginosa]|nr:methylcrotonyl-CoA carboxylase subunit beta [Pseudomonas aeruginosa]
MAILHTQINPRSAEFAANAATMLEQVNALRTLLGRIHEGGGSAAQARHSARGKLLVRERINRLLDPARRSSSFPPSPPTKSTAKRSPPPASSPGSAGSKGWNA